MIIWNVQGAKEAQLQLEIGFVSRTINPDILILTKKIINEQNTQHIVKSLGFHNYDIISFPNHVGGIWLLWDTDNVEVKVLAEEA